MLIPIALPPAPQGPPTALQLKMKPTLVGIVSLQAFVAVCRLVALDIWGGICDLLTVVIGYYTITETAITHTIWYGTSCALLCFFDTVSFVVRLGKLQSNYFDLSAGFLFNLSSFAILAASVTALLGAGVCYAVVRDYSRNSPEALPFFEPQGHQYAAFSAPPPPSAGYGHAAAPGAGGGGGFAAFAGPGRRLGADNSDVELPPPPANRPPPDL